MTTSTNNPLSTIQARLFALQDTGYREFNAKLIPTVEKERVIGVRTPALRAMAKEMRKEGYTTDTEAFMNSLPHFYFEENQLHAFLISETKDADECVRLLDTFLPYIDNWATCDQLNPKAFRKMAKAGTLPEYARRWMASPKPYVVRFGINVLMNYYLEADTFQTGLLDEVAGISHQAVAKDYYVRMMVAWYFATALAKQYDATLPYIKGHKLEDWTHRKAIQKACESYRLSAEQKAEIRAMR